MKDQQKECNSDRVLSPTHPNSFPCGAFVNSGAAYSGSACSTGGVRNSGATYSGSACSTGGVRSSGGADNCGAYSDGVGSAGSIGMFVRAESVL